MHRLNFSLGLSVLFLCLTLPSASGQIRGVEKGSAEEADRIRKYLDNLPKKTTPPEPLVVGDKEFLPQLSAKSLKEGGKYATSSGLGGLDLGFTNTWAQVVQVIDDNSMLVGIDNGADGSGVLRYEVVVMCKFPTKGITDGKKDYLGEVLGTKEVAITGTTKYKTTGGGTRTVFVMEPYTRPKKADVVVPVVKAPSSGSRPARVDVSSLRDRVIGAHAVVDYLMEKEKLTLEEKAYVNEYANYGLQKSAHLLKGLDEKKIAAFVAREEVKAWKEAEDTYQKALGKR